jgi:hypothetical protein
MKLLKYECINYLSNYEGMVHGYLKLTGLTKYLLAKSI